MKESDHNSNEINVICCNWSKLYHICKDYFLFEFHPLVMRFIKYYFDREHSGSTVLLKVDEE